jgi:hypothetical protein
MRDAGLYAHKAPLGTVSLLVVVTFAKPAAHRRVRTNVNLNQQRPTSTALHAPFAGLLIEANRPSAATGQIKLTLLRRRGGR